MVSILQGLRRGVFGLAYCSVLFGVLIIFAPFWSWAVNLSVPRLVSEQVKGTQLAPVVPKNLAAKTVPNACTENCHTGGTFQTEFGIFMSTSGTSVSNQCRPPQAAKLRLSVDLKTEALASLHVAKDMEAGGKLEKASKLFQHAVALDPTNSEILTEYGTFLEKHHNDILRADTFYLRAVYADPGNHRALKLRVRILPLVEDIDQRAFDRIDGLLREFYMVPQFDPLMVKKKRMAFVWQLHHSVAIEGNTMSFMETQFVLEKRLTIGGKSIMEHNEILGMDAALQFLNETLAGRIGPIRLSDVLDMHLRVLGYNDPINAGKFREAQVYIADHIPPDSKDVPKLMDEFMDWLNSEDAAQMHPIKLSTLAHYFLVHIHPFVDGNGRIARLLMNLILIRSGIPPVVIRVSERKLYYQHLKEANAGDIRPLVRFITKCTEMTLNAHLYSATEADMFTAFPHLSAEDSGDKILLPATGFVEDELISA